MVGEVKLYVLLALSQFSTFGRTKGFGEGAFFDICFFLNAVPWAAGVEYGICWTSFILALLLYQGVIFRFFRMSALGSQTPCKAACEENDCNQSFMNGSQ